MKIFLGTDIVHTPRFVSWLSYPAHKLETTFSAHECAVFAKKPSSQFLASRFAAKESCYKALSQLLAATQNTNKSFSFHRFAPHCWIEKAGCWHLPSLILDRVWLDNQTGAPLPELTTQVSIAHDGEYCVAQVLLCLP